MTLEEGIQSLAKLEIELRDVYLNRVIDFLKWTSTFAIAASLWIGTNFEKFVEPTSKTIIEKQSDINPLIANLSDFVKGIDPIFFITSFASIMMSVFVAVIIFYVIIGLWGLEWKYIGKMNSIIDIYNKNRDKKTFSDDELSKQIDDVKKFHFNFENIKTINFFFKTHVFLLIVGLFCFYIGVMFH